MKAAMPLRTVRLVGRCPLLEETCTVTSWNVNNLDLTELTWISPFDVVALALLAERARSAGGALRVLLPADPQVRAYLVDVGLPAFLPGRWGRGGSAVEAPLLPLTHLRRGEEWDDLLRTFWPAARSRLGNFELAERTIDILSELIDNAATHGASSAGTIVCAQHYTGTTSGEPAGIQLGVADGGVGIPQHLRRNPRYRAERDDIELIRQARRPWVTGTADRRGWGLWEVFDKASELAPSRVLIRSARAEGRFWLYGGAPAARYRRIRPAIPGTWVHVQLDTMVDRTRRNL